MVVPNKASQEDEAPADGEYADLSLKAKDAEY